uniref:CP n=1 Tax=Agave tequilana vitivirus 1 TaxID=2794429 RepID=A0A7T5QZC1_9VIRU|nr:CP [Agave tequilana vitivirus 1]
MSAKERREAVLTLLSVKAPGVSLEPRDDAARATTNNVLANVFGNIALVGTSSKVNAYPSIIKIYDLGAGKLDDAMVEKEEVKLGEIIIALLTLSRAATRPPMAGLTLRQMCEPFAIEAYLFLKVAANSNIYSNLARKMTRAGNKEPQVMFDFAKGLPITKLTKSEASAMQVMHQRLFRTEGAKGVFEAQSNVGENAVEL